MTRMLKLDAVLIVIAATYVLISLTVDAASKTEMKVCLLGANTLAETWGATPNYKVATGNPYCACLFVQQNPMAGAVCDCTLVADGTPCILCVGNSYYSGVYASGYSGWQPSGGSSLCSAFTAMAGDCEDFVCSDAIINFGPCVGRYPAFETQDSG